MEQNQTNYRLFAICPPGLEKILARELELLGINGQKLQGGIEYSGDLLTLYSTNLWLRTASRVLVRIGKVKILSLKEASEKFSRYPWEIYIGNKTTIRARVSCHKSKIYHSNALAERLAEGISKRLGHLVRIVKDSENPTAPLVFARIVKDRCVISIDSSGEHLHKRGYKKFTVMAPLRENLASAMLLGSNYNGDMTLLDPFCGSGTIPIEGAMIASRIPPGKNRRFAFMKWSNFDNALWKKIIERSEVFERKPNKPIIGIDKDPHAIEASLANIQMARLENQISIHHMDFLDFIPDNLTPGLIVTNPPYGKRIKENDGLLEFYSKLGTTLKKRFKNWKLSIILPVEYPGFKKNLGLQVKRICKFTNGGIKVELLHGSI